MSFHIYVDNANQYRWRLTAANNRIVAVSGEGYHNRADCQHAITLVKTHGPDAPVN
jgi:uncharacterized protein YegP (UPF0339 family)